MKERKFYKLASSYWPYVICFAIFLTIGLSPYYMGGAFIFGGEANYIINFKIRALEWQESWTAFLGLGKANAFPSSSFGTSVYILALLFKLTGSIQIVNFFLVFTLYFSPFFSMFLLAREMKIRPHTSFVVSCFYVVNPFTLYYLISLNQWNVLTLAAFPLFFWIILKYFNDELKLYLYFGIASAVLAFGTTNPPLFLILHFSIIISVVLVCYHYNGKVFHIQTFKKYAIVLLSYISFNLGWMIVTTYHIIDAVSAFSLESGKNWIIANTANFDIVDKQWRLKSIIPADPNYDFYSVWFNSTLADYILLIPVFLTLFFILAFGLKATHPNRRVLNFLGIILAVLIFLIKGVRPPFKGIFLFLTNHVPFFYGFKTPQIKFGLLFIFINTLLYIYALSSQGTNRKAKIVVGLLSVYLIYCSVPVLSNNLIPERFDNTWGRISRKYFDLWEYQKARNALNQEENHHKILSMPGHLNYQILMTNIDNRKYSGIDPILRNINKPVVTASTTPKTHSLFKNTASSNYFKLLGIYNIGSIFFNENTLPWFGLVEKTSTEHIRQNLSRVMPQKHFNNFTILHNYDAFIPLIYAAQNSIILEH